MSSPDSSSPTAQQEMRQIVDDQPPDATYDEILRKLAFKRMIDRGLMDEAQGRILDSSELHQQIEGWLA